MHICKPPQGFAFGIRKEFGPPRRPLGPLARNILGGIAVARLGAPKDSRAIYLPPAISLRRRHATSSSRGFLGESGDDRWTGGDRPTGLGEFGDGRGTMGDGETGAMGTGTTDCEERWALERRTAIYDGANTDCDLALRAKFFGRMARGKKFREGLDENAKRLEIPPLGTLQTHLQLCKSPEMQS